MLGGAGLSRGEERQESCEYFGDAGRQAQSETNLVHREQVTVVDIASRRFQVLVGRIRVALGSRQAQESVLEGLRAADQAVWHERAGPTSDSSSTQAPTPFPPARAMAHIGILPL